VALERVNHHCEVHPRRVLTLWLVVMLAAGWVWWSGRDDLSTAIGSEHGSSSELFRTWVTAPPNPGDRRLVCASDAGGVTSGVVPSSWLDLDSASAVTLSEYTGRCYTAKWDFLGDGNSAARGFPVDEGDSREDTPLDSPPFLTLPPEIVESWRAGSESTMSLGDIGDGVHADILRAERTALPFILLILLVMIRNPVMALLPLLNGVIVSVVATGMLILLASTFTVSIHVLSIVTMFGLALGTDYSLLRAMRANHAPAPGPVASGTGQDGSRISVTIVVAGIAVLGSSLGLLAVPLSIFRDVALGIAIVVTVAVTAAITLVPALMRLLPTPRIDLFRWAIWRGNGWPGSRQRPWQGRNWTWPVRVLAVLALAMLAGLGWQATSLRTAITITAPDVARQDPTAESYDAYMRGSLVEVRLSSVDIVIAGPRFDSSLERLLDFIGDDADFAPVVLVDSFPADGVYVLRAIAVRPAESELSSVAIGRLRQTALNIEVDEDGATVLLGGPLMTYDHVIGAIEERQVVAGLLALMFAGGVMAVLVRRKLVSLLAVAGSLLSFGAAIGTLVLVVQEGFGAAVLGVERAPHIESWVPIVLFCVLLGMGIDYHMFLAGGVLDAMADGVPLGPAIAQGYRTVGPVVIAASLTMALVLGGFVLGEMVAIQQLGIGLASGILLDAFLVRLLVIPAIAILASHIGSGKAVACPPPPR
jgi:RND superfamily putative drug exporter